MTMGVDCCLLWLQLHGAAWLGVFSGVWQERTLKVTLEGLDWVRLRKGGLQMSDELQARFGVAAWRRVGAAAEAMSQLSLGVGEVSPDTVGGAEGEQTLALLPHPMDAASALQNRFE